MSRRRSLALILIAAWTLAAFVPFAAAQELEDAPPIKDNADQQQPAQEGEQAPVEGEEEPPPAKKGPFGGMELPIILLGVMALLFFFSGRSRRKKESARKEMLANISKGDKVTSIGGIVGTVMDVREDEVTVKVDESSNTRMKFARWAIRGIGADGAKEAPDQK